MRIPRDCSGAFLIKQLEKLSYAVTRQSGSHVRVTTQKQGEHHLTVPNHKSLRLGTIANIIGDVAKHFELSKEQIISLLFE